MDKLISILVLLIISNISFAQKSLKKKELPLGESWESDYKIYSPNPRHYIYESYYYRYYGNKDTIYRIYSISFRGDTAEIFIDKLPQIIQKSKYIRIGDKIYVPYSEPERLFEIRWNYCKPKIKTNERQPE